jgi:fructose-specific phosphotransferase system component IIB
VGGKKIGTGGIMTGADGIITGKDLKSAGSRAEAGAHSITISYKICIHKEENIIEKLKRKRKKLVVVRRIYLLIFI